MNKNLTATQNDYAVFLPATSGFYATFIGKQRYGNYVEPARIPKSFTTSIESLNYLEPDAGLFYYKWCLYSAGHANLDLSKKDDSEDMFRNRDRSTSLVVGDSGGFQIGKGVWEGEWRDPNSQEVKALMADAVSKGIQLVPQLDASGNPKLDKNGNPKHSKVDHVKLYQARLDAAQQKRDSVLRWMDALMDYGMVLDIPAWVCRSPAGIKATGISSYQDAVNATKYNNQYWIKHRTGACKFLNVLQGETHSEAEDWYQQMKEFCDPKVYGDKAFNGWAMGGQNMCDIHLVLKRLVALRHDGLLEKGQQDWMHFLGTSKLEWAVLLTDIQRAVRKYHNENFTISFDCASPFLATANGQIYIQTETEDRTKWVYRMVPSADDKKYASDTRLFKDAVIQDKIFKNFQSSPIIDQVEMKDVCIYAPGDKNKIGKEGKTSWDSFSYAIMMGHNVWMHCNSVQEANRQYDLGKCPNMLVNEKFNRVFFKDIIEAIFATNNRQESEDIIEEYDKYWQTIIGTRGATGKKTVNASTMFANLFDLDDPNLIQSDHDEEFSEEEQLKLDQLESQVKE
ncbi:MAG: hypothetical protein RLZZ196_1884 [Bacteroidota bacterium]